MIRVAFIITALLFLNSAYSQSAQIDNKVWLIYTHPEWERLESFTKNDYLIDVYRVTINNETLNVGFWFSLDGERLRKTSASTVNFETAVMLCKELFPYETTSFKAIDEKELMFQKMVSFDETYLVPNSMVDLLMKDPGKDNELHHLEYATIRQYLKENSGQSYSLEIEMSSAKVITTGRKKVLSFGVSF